MKTTRSTKSLPAIISALKLTDAMRASLVDAIDAGRDNAGYTYKINEVSAQVETSRALSERDLTIELACRRTVLGGIGVEVARYLAANKVGRTMNVRGRTVAI